MEVRVRERLIGALILVAIVVLFVPAVLTGRGTEPVQPPAQPTRRVEIPVAGAERVAEEQVLVPEPLADAPAKAATSVPAGKPRETKTDEAPPAAPVKAPTPAPAARTAGAAAEPQRPDVASQAPAWAVQLGAFSNRAKAEQLVAELRKRRYAAFLLEYRASGQVLYRVRVGPEQDRTRAEEIATRLTKDGFQPVVARHP